MKIGKMGQATLWSLYGNNMELMTFSTTEQFIRKIESSLRSHEALNSILIGTLLQSKGSKPLSLGAYFQMSQLELAWMLTHDNILILTEGTDKALQLLANYLSQQCLQIYRLRGSASSINTFIRLSGLSIHKSMTQNIYEFSEIILQHQSPGHIRKGELSDIPFLQPWIEMYIEETKLDYTDPYALLKKLIEQERLFLWENNKTILSIAACSGLTFTGIRIHLAFTPIDYRGNGYASSCISALGDYLLRNGHSKCFIFADQENRTANSIYQKMGGSLKGINIDCKISI